jgi:glycosyltransferase involved in cell wall biosynthesis
VISGPTREVFRARLNTVAPHFGLARTEIEALGARGTGALLQELARIARDHPTAELAWLLFVGVAGSFPIPSELRRLRRRLDAVDSAFLHRAALEVGLRNPNGVLDDVQLEVVTDQPVIDVNFCARFEHNTGIQRVVRQIMARWHGTRRMLPVAWTDDSGAMRRLSGAETERVVHFSARRDASSAPSPRSLVVPFRTSVQLLEVPFAHLCARLEALAEYSGNRVSLLGYDTIPVVSADTVPDTETERFVHYLSVVKHADLVVGISRTAAQEFAGFASAVTAQGLPGPRTMAVTLPVDIPDAVNDALASDGARRTVLCVGSHEPRKNHFAVLYAAEVLWRDGLDFDLVFVGSGSAWYTRIFDRAVQGLRQRGRSVEVLRRVDDAALLAQYQRAAFTVFPSLHEGYGLPVAESLALGVPVITTSYGSTAEIAHGGGCLTVDPRDDDELVAAMRELLADPDRLAALRQEIAMRPRRTWDDYADELWSALQEEAIDA